MAAKNHSSTPAKLPAGAMVLAAVTEIDRLKGICETARGALFRSKSLMDGAAAMLKQNAEFENDEELISTVYIIEAAQQILEQNYDLLDVGSIGGARVMQEAAEREAANG